MRSAFNSLGFSLLATVMTSCVTPTTYVTNAPTASEINTARALISREGTPSRNSFTEAQNIARLNRVSERLDRPARELCRALGEQFRLSDCDYEIHYDDKNVFNAYATEQDGEKLIVVDTGLLNYTQTDDQLAFVLGHEIGHHILSHFSDQLGFTVGEAVGLIVGAAIALDPESYATAEQRTDLISSAFSLGSLADRPAYNQSQESEADLVGLKLLLSAGYSWEEGVKFLASMANIGNSGSFFSTHPAGDERLASYIKAMNSDSFARISSLERRQQRQGYRDSTNVRQNSDEVDSSFQLRLVDYLSKLEFHKYYGTWDIGDPDSEIYFFGEDVTNRMIRRFTRIRFVDSITDTTIPNRSMLDIDREEVLALIEYRILGFLYGILFTTDGVFMRDPSLEYISYSELRASPIETAVLSAGGDSQNHLILIGDRVQFNRMIPLGPKTDLDLFNDIKSL